MNLYEELIEPAVNMNLYEELIENSRKFWKTLDVEPAVNMMGSSARHLTLKLQSI